MAKAKQCIQPALQYFQRRFCHISGDQHNSVQLLKAARLCNSKFVGDTRPDFAPVDRLHLISLLNDDGTICDLKKELPEYEVAAQHFEDGTVQPNWWRHHDHLPCWRKATSMILLISPSSAAFERVFFIARSKLVQLPGSASQRQH